SRDFKYVASAAGTKIQTPAGPDIKYYSALSRISGTANPYTEKVFMELRKRSGEYWHDPEGDRDGYFASGSTSVLVAAGLPVPENWNYIFSPAVSWVDGSSYTVSAVGYNGANRPEQGPPAVEFRIDKTAPDTFLVYPGASDFYSDIGTIHGTAGDLGQNPSGISKVRLRLQRQGTPDWKYYDNVSSTWTDSSNWATNEGVWWGSSWTFVVNYPTAAWQNGVTYKLEVKALDNAIDSDNPSFIGNEDLSPVEKIFTFDTGAATATLSVPVHGRVYSSLSFSSGAVADNNLPVDNVRLYIYDQAANKYWKGAEWGEQGVVESTTTAVFYSSWTFAALPPQFGAPASDAKRYVFWAQAQDRAGNYQTLFSTTALSSATVVFDHSGPAITEINVAPGDRLTTLASLHGEVLDPNYPDNAGVSTNTSVEVRISFDHQGDTYYYDDISFSSTPAGSVWRNPSVMNGYAPLGPSSGTWTYAKGLPEGWLSDRSYTITVRARDDASPSPNYGAELSIADVVIDTTPPVCVISTPAAGTTLIRDLSLLAGTASGDLAGLEKVEFAIKLSMPPPATSYFDGAGFLSAATVYFSVSGGEGAGASVAWSSATSAALRSALVDGSSYTLYAYATDLAGNSQKTSGGAPSFTFRWYTDTDAPSVSVLEPYRVVHSTLPLIRGTAADATGSATGAGGVLSGLWLRVRQNDPSVLWWDPALQLFRPENELSSEQAWFSPETQAGYTIWSTTQATRSFINGRQYSVHAKSSDTAGNFSVAYSSFVWDADRPVSVTTLPASGSYVNAASFNTEGLSGTAYDPVYADYAQHGVQACVDRMDIGIRRLSDGRWWSQALYEFNIGPQVEPYFDPSINIVVTGSCTASAGWAYRTILASVLDQGASYYAVARASDTSGLLETDFLTGGSTFTYDNVPPTGSVGVPVAGAYYSSLPSLSGSSADDILLSTVSLSIRLAGGNWYVPGSGFVSGTQNWFKAQGTPSAWTYGFGVQPWSSGSEYIVYSSATDMASNAQAAVSSASFHYDLHAPTAALVSPP
ncbi:MAG TPA: hypothetical protein PKK31_08375, partial [Elusimicrobiales bacterium]|nr:hypothetical protein [Elusimicrobiales bacterium]